MARLSLSKPADALSALYRPARGASQADRRHQPRRRQRPPNPLYRFPVRRRTLRSRYGRDQLFGGHVIMLGPGNEDAAIQALAAFPGGLQVGGGIRPDNAATWLSRGAAQVIVTSYVFSDGQLHRNRLAQMVAAVGRERLVLDLSCSNRDGCYVVMTDRWQQATDFAISADNLVLLAESCSEFLIHATGVEGKQQGSRCRTRRALRRDRTHPDDVCRWREQPSRHRHYRPSGPREIGFYGGSGAGYFRGHGAALRGYAGIQVEKVLA